MDYSQTLKFLYSQLPMFQKVGGAALKYNLLNINRLMHYLGNPHKKIKTIHVAGTNGKGSSSHMLASVLQEAGYNTGLYTSPHLRSFTERIKINGQEIDELAVVNFVAQIEELLEEDLKPSFFEITLAMAMQYFVQQKVDIAIIEVGLGGRLDSTNIIQPEICLITNISYDHQQFLGETLPEIAGEKAGIIKKEIPVVISEYQPKIAQVFIDKAANEQAPIMFADKQLRLEQAAGGRINVIKGNEIIHEGLRLDLNGSYQNHNVLGVIAVLDKLNDSSVFSIGETSLHNGLANVVSNTGLKGRWQIVHTKPLTITDTGHNISGVKEIINEIKDLKFNKLHMVWGMVKDKDPMEILLVLPKFAQYYFVAANLPRARTAEKLLQEANEAGLNGKSYNSVMAGYKAALRQAADDDLIFIGGSTFVVAEIEDL